MVNYHPKVNPKDGDARKIHINAINTPTKEVSGSTSIVKSDDIHIVQVQKKVAPLREYRPDIPFPERLKQVELGVVIGRVMGWRVTGWRVRNVNPDTTHLTNHVEIFNPNS